MECKENKCKRRDNKFGVTWCYYVDEDCFISLKKAKELGFINETKS